ncbi:MAG: DNA recombination protein RmuC [Bacteroidetes bacterium]|nr:DNA recombination protein RmuC [Bacteroidota bacterium]
MDSFTLVLLFFGCIVIALLIFMQQKKTVGLPEGAVSRDLYQTIVTQHEMLRSELQSKEQELRIAQSQAAAHRQTIQHLETQLQQQKAEWQQMQTRMQTEFENIASRLFEEKNRLLSDRNAQQIQGILAPLREKIREFESNIERKFLEETREKAGLKKELEQLHQMNLQLSQDANNLAGALKGQSKVQGDWGELQLEVLLEKSGLSKGVHYMAQNTYRDEQGLAKRPDFIIHLPDEKHLIIDAKVSLTAFERFFNENDPLLREKHLKAHIESIRSHIDQLSRKNYPQLQQLHTPDYLLLFIPLESALSTALQADPRLLTDAVERNIILVTTSSLLSTMRTVAMLWKQEKQTRSVLEIARQSGLLYDKFVAFVEDLRTVGLRLGHAQEAYDAAMHKLVNAGRPGDTLIGKAEKIRALGARTTKSLPADLIEASEATDLPEISEGKEAPPDDFLPT